MSLSGVRRLARSHLVKPLAKAGLFNKNVARAKFLRQ